MKIEFEDGMVFNYIGSLRITKGNEVDVVIEKEFIPVRLRDDLKEITRRINHDIKKIALLITDAVGQRACISDDSEDWATCQANLESKFPAFDRSKENFADILEEGKPFGD